MPEIVVSAQGTVAAPAERVYRIIADYERHHPNILPPAFSDFMVEEGGVGEGTVMRFKVTTAGRTQAFHQRVTEPEPGHVLHESNIDGNLVTTWTVTPDGDGSRVHIETRWQTGGVRGVIEQLLAPRMMRSLYADELARLDRYAREHPEI